MDEENQLFKSLEEYRSACMMFLVRRSATASDAEDCVQVALESILKIARERNDYTPENYSRLLYDIAWKRMKDLWRNKHSQHERLETTEYELAADSSAPAISREDREMMRRALRAIFEQFHPAKGDLLYFYLIENRSYASLAILFQMTEGSVITTVSTLKTRFKTWVRDHDLHEQIWDLFQGYFRDGHWPWECGTTPH